MNRSILPVATAAGLVLGLLGASLLPVQQPAVDGSANDTRARVAVACPTIVGAADPTAIAAGSPQGALATAPLEQPDNRTLVTGTLAVTPRSSGPVLVTAPRLDAFSGTSRSAATEGSARGLSMMSCDRPTASQWFAGVRSSNTATAEVVLLNADAQDATVDLTVYGAEGRVTAPGSRGIIVPALSRRVVPLGPLFNADQPVSLHVSTSAGRVAAAVRQRLSVADQAAGSDWLPPTADPATSVAIPGLPAGKGARDLVVVNPGDRTASVALQVLGANGQTAVPGFETLDLPPGTSRVIPLGNALAEAPVGLRLVSEQKVTAAVLSDNGAAAGGVDFATQIATTALTRPGVLALAPGGRVSPVLHLTNGGADPVTARVSVTDAAATSLLDVTVTVPGLADTTVALPRAENVLIGVQPGASGALYASVAVRAALEGVTGVASLAVLPGAAAATLPPIRHDPRVGS